MNRTPLNSNIYIYLHRYSLPAFFPLESITSCTRLSILSTQLLTVSGFNWVQHSHMAALHALSSRRGFLPIVCLGNCQPFSMMPQASPK